ncbi:efflux RND transporter permease subunit [Escherichia coli]
MTAKDVTDAIESQNAQIAVGQTGGTPSIKQALNATINAQSLLQTPEQFRDITLRVNQDGSEVRLGDVATVEMGRRNTIILAASMKPASGLGVNRLRRKRNGDSGAGAQSSRRAAQYSRMDWNTRWRMKPPRLLKPPLKTW